MQSLFAAFLFVFASAELRVSKRSTFAGQQSTASLSGLGGGPSEFKHPGLASLSSKYGHELSDYTTDVDVLRPLLVNCIFRW